MSYAGTAHRKRNHYLKSHKNGNTIAGELKEGIRRHKPLWNRKIRRSNEMLHYSEYKKAVQTREEAFSFR